MRSSLLVRCCGSPLGFFPTRPRGRAVALGSWLLPTRPTKDFHLQFDAHAWHTYVGLRPSFVTPAATQCHPDCRWLVIQIVALHFKLVECAQKNWRRLEGHNKLPKIIDGVKFLDGIEFAAKIDGPRSLRSRLALATTEKQRAKDIA